MSLVFQLDPRIAEGSLPLGRLELCEVRLVNDSRYPWALLVPQRADVKELFQLASTDRSALIEEAADLAARMSTAFQADKMNVGSLGNRVAQFHLHVVVRRRGDSAWPDAVWNGTAAVPYGSAERDAVLAKMKACLARPGRSQPGSDGS